MLEVEVDPFLEIAEIHRLVIALSGPALLFKNFRGSSFPVVTNFFGSKHRLELAFGSRPLDSVIDLVRTLEDLSPSPGNPWFMRGLIGKWAELVQNP